jgi:hypothetical protein
MVGAHRQRVTAETVALVVDIITWESTYRRAEETTQKQIVAWMWRFVRRVARDLQLH